MGYDESLEQNFHDANNSLMRQLYNTWWSIGYKYYIKNMVYNDKCILKYCHTLAIHSLNITNNNSLNSTHFLDEVLLNEKIYIHTLLCANHLNYLKNDYNYSAMWAYKRIYRYRCKL